MTEITVVKISTDMPLPTPRSVISSPIHMMTVVPATMVITIVAMVKGEPFGMSGLLAAAPQPLNRVPDLASSTYPVDWSTARPTVRYLVYWVILDCPAWPSCFSVSSRGITTVSSCRMMLAVMYGMMPSANTDKRSSAWPLSRLTMASTPAVELPAAVAAFEQKATFFSSMPGVGSEAPNRNKCDEAQRDQHLLAKIRRLERPHEGRQHAQSSVRLVGQSTYLTRHAMLCLPRSVLASSLCWPRSLCWRCSPPGRFAAPPSLVAPSSLLSPGSAAPLRLAHPGVRKAR